MAKIKVKDGMAQYLKRVQALDGHGVKSGIQANAGQQDGTDILDIALYNEFGTQDIPARPFIRGFQERNAKALGALMDRTANLIAQGKPAGPTLDQMGAVVQQQQQAHVRASKSWAVPNAPSTVKNKGSDVPLIDHAVLVNSIRYEKI